MTWLGGHCCHQRTPGSAADTRIDSEPAALLCPTGTWRRLALAQPGFTVCFPAARLSKSRREAFLLPRWEAGPSPRLRHREGGSGAGQLKTATGVPLRGQSRGQAGNGGGGKVGGRLARVVSYKSVNGLSFFCIERREAKGAWQAGNGAAMGLLWPVEFPSQKATPAFFVAELKRSGCEE